MRKMMKLMILAFLGISISAIEISAQCVQCKLGRTRGALTCQSSSSGGIECVSDGVACTIAGACGRAGIAQKTSEESLGTIQIDETILREIAAKLPRFAIVLSLIGQ